MNKYTTCASCGKSYLEYKREQAEKLSSRVWFSLHNSQGRFSGNWCPDCFDDIQVDSKGEPLDSKRYYTAAVRYELKRRALWKP